MLPFIFFFAQSSCILRLPKKKLKPLVIENIGFYYKSKIMPYTKEFPATEICILQS